jgi:hypothetical protein
MQTLVVRGEVASRSGGEAGLAIHPNAGAKAITVASLSAQS